MWRKAVLPSLAFEPEKWRDTIWAVTGAFESGNRVDMYQNHDRGIISYGKHQATLATNGLVQVLRAYFERSSSATSLALQHEYEHRVAAHDESLRHDERLKALLMEAAKEPAMEAAQDVVFAVRYYAPAVARARKVNVRTPLGLGAIYDHGVQGGVDNVMGIVAERLGPKIGQYGVNGRFVDEKSWIASLLNEREAWLNRVADRWENEGDIHNANFLRYSTFRVRELRKLLQAGNLLLSGTFIVWGQRVQGIDVATTPETVILPDGVEETSDAAYIRDVNIFDNTRVAAGVRFEKRWLVENNGQTTWKKGFRLVYSPDRGRERLRLAQKDGFDLTEVMAVPTVSPGEQVQLKVAMQAPQEPATGAVTSYWQLVDDQGDPFGDPIFVKIQIVPSERTARIRTAIAENRYFTGLRQAVTRLTGA